MSVAYTIQELKQTVRAAECYSDVCRMLGITVCTFNINRIKKLCASHNISVSHFNVKRTFRRGKPTKWTPETLFTSGSKIHRGMLRPVLIRLGHYSNQCSICKTPDVWNGKPLTLEVDHINGICEDNRADNLRWVCPNCHSQTDSYRSRTTRRKNVLTQNKK